ncbi:MAG: Gfo/Idh/MocA family oxidoreductase [Chloroflexi bacterium]|nr:Gfo/Idh/MocA family oxidoreductase [Chloroflexota bacterium]
MAAKTRAVMVGCGGITRSWLTPLKDMEDVQIVGLVDIVEQNARARAEEYGLADAEIGTELDLVLRLTQPDVVFNCTVPEAHASVSIAAMEFGCHVLQEKPLADSVENARRMIAAAEKAGRILAVIQNRRYDPNIRRLRNVVASQAIGALTTANCDFYLGAHFGGFRDHMPHVLLLDMAIHTFDAARLITGVDPVSVYCKEWNPAGSWYDRDASAVAIFEMTGGLIYTYRGSWCAEGLNTTWESNWHLVGTRGSLHWDGALCIEGEKVAESGGFRSALEAVEIPVFDAGSKVGAHGGVIREFLHSVRTGVRPETSAHDNIKSLAMVFGAIESAETGREVRISVE